MPSNEVAYQIIADALFAWMESNLSAYNVGFEYLPADAAGLMLQSNAEQPIAKEYKSGRKVYTYRFSLLMRADNADTHNRVSAQESIKAAADSICNATLTGFDVWEIKQDSTARVISTEERYDVVMLQMHITYEVRG